MALLSCDRGIVLGTLGVELAELVNLARAIYATQEGADIEEAPTSPLLAFQDIPESHIHWDLDIWSRKLVIPYVADPLPYVARTISSRCPTRNA